MLPSSDDAQSSDVEHMLPSDVCDPQTLIYAPARSISSAHTARSDPGCAPQLFSEGTHVPLLPHSDGSGTPLLPRHAMPLSLQKYWHRSPVAAHRGTTSRYPSARVRRCAARARCVAPCHAHVAVAAIRVRAARGVVEDVAVDGFAVAEERRPGA